MRNNRRGRTESNKGQLPHYPSRTECSRVSEAWMTSLIGLKSHLLNSVQHPRGRQLKGYMCNTFFMQWVPPQGRKHKAHHFFCNTFAFTLGECVCVIFNLVLNNSECILGVANGKIHDSPRPLFENPSPRPRQFLNQTRKKWASETLYKCCCDSEIRLKFSKTHDFLGTIRYPSYCMYL